MQSQSARPVWGRTWAIALLGVMGVFFDARPAQAMGCHVVDRPVLGLATSLDLPFNIDAVVIRTDRVEFQVVPRPCQGEVPDLSLRALSPLAILEPTPASCPTDRTPERVIPGSPTNSSRLCSSRLDRPPRPSAEDAAQNLV